MAIEGLTFLDPTPSIDPVAQVTDLKKLADDEAFMNERVVIMIPKSSDQNQAPYVLLNVNGRNQHVQLDRPVAVRRMFVEVLARMKETRYSQETPNPMQPDQIANVASHTNVYPFSIVRDENPRGFAWLQHILAEPA